MLRKRLRAYLKDLLADPPAPPPVRGPWPCGVLDCFEDQVIVRQDEKETVSECPVHQCVTTWDTTPKEKKEQIIIRVQDNWRQHGTSEPPK